MIEKLRWNDALKVKPDHNESVLLWVVSDRRFSTPGWTVGYWENGEWWETETGLKTIWIVTHWTVPNGPDDRFEARKERTT